MSKDFVSGRTSHKRVTFLLKHGEATCRNWKNPQLKPSHSPKPILSAFFSVLTDPHSGGLALGDSFISIVPGMSWFHAFSDVQSEIYTERNNAQTIADI